jgi:hypothetical protein
MMVEPRHLDQLLHPMFENEKAYQRDVITKGLGASPGAAVGKLVFTAGAARCCFVSSSFCTVERLSTAVLLMFTMLHSDSICRFTYSRANLYLLLSSGQILCEARHDVFLLPALLCAALQFSCNLQRMLRRGRPRARQSSCAGRRPARRMWAACTQQRAS